MRLKTLSLAALAAMAAMAFVGTSSAMAEETALCSVNQSPCEEGNVVTSVHMALSSGAVWKFSTSSFTVLCLGVLAEASVGEPGAPQAIDITSLVYTGCGTGSTHNNCTLTSTASGGNPDEATLLETADNLGDLEVTDEGAAVEFACSNVGIKCKYSFAGQWFHVEGATEANHGMLTPEALPLEETSGGFGCPETTEVTDGLLEPLEDTYIAQGQGDSGIGLALPLAIPDLMEKGEEKILTITNKSKTEKIEIDSVKLPGGSFSLGGVSCVSAKVDATKTCATSTVKCVAKGNGVLEVLGHGLGGGGKVKQTLKLHCHEKADL